MGHGLLSETLYARELELEEDSISRGVLRYRKLAADATKRGAAASLKVGERLLLHWYKAYVKQIRAEKKGCAAHPRGHKGRMTYRHYITQLGSEKMAVVAMHTVLSKCMIQPEAKATAVALAIGRAICAEVNVKAMKRDKDIWDEVLHTDRKQIKPRGVLRVLRRHTPQAVWSLKVQGQLGAMLIKLLVQIASVKVKGGAAWTRQAAFKVWNDKSWGRRTPRVIALTEEAWKVIEDGHSFRQTLKPRFQPMVVPPATWTEEYAGGYIKQATDLVKKAGGLKLKAPPQVVEAANCINKTAWRINKKILDVVLALWEQGGGVAGIPQMSDIPKPLVPADFETNADSKKAWKREAVRIRRENLKLKAARVVFGFKMDIATRFQKYGKIYFPHQFDFRGRAYSIPLHLNHQGDDVCRGLLEFAVGRPCDDDMGPVRRWLGIHMANCCGIDKVSFADRIAYVQSRLGDFRRWSDDPLTYSGWMDTEKPFQSLSAACALFDQGAAAHIPIQVDGSNNAFQHYAAMLRCEKTGALVNLIPRLEPADVYADVAERTVAEIGEAAGEGDEIAQSLEGWITRKVVKQTVMTSPYNVTKIGARRQIYGRLKEAGFDQGKIYTASYYLGCAVRDAVGHICVGPTKAMEWLVACAKLIAPTGTAKKREGRAVKWTTFLGLNVEQPYKSSRMAEVRTMLGRMYLGVRHEDCPVAPSRQANGFAPNFIHSMDAAHMMMVSVRAHSEKMTTAVVHDSYWTHAATMGRMGEIIREEFIRLHAEPALLTLHEHLCKTYPGIDFPDPPECGTLNLAGVMDSEYFFA